LARGLLWLARPKQWVKNVLVFAAPAFAGVLTQAGALADALVAFVAFCLAASGTYYVNDARDVKADREHDRKRLRPVAAGVVPVRLAYLSGGLLMAAALAVSLLAGVQLLAVVAGYLALTSCYSLWLKREPVVDLVAVAAGFVLRVVAGAVAPQLAISTWFLIVASLGSLFIVAGKREAELRNLPAAEPAGDGIADDDAEPSTRSTRATLASYSIPFLNYVQSAATGALLVSYCLWAFDLHVGTARLLFGLSIVPFAIGVLRYAMLVDAGQGEEPEDLVGSDRILLSCALVLVVLVGVGVYVV